MGFARWRRGFAANLFVALLARLASAQPSPPVSDDGPVEPAPEAAPSVTAPAEPAPDPKVEEPWIAPKTVSPAPAPAAPLPRLRTQDGWIPPNMPKTLPYHSGAPTPPGYQFESMPRWGMIIPGTILFGFGHSLAVGIALEEGYEDRYWLFVPVFGPTARIIAEKSECDRRRGSENCQLGTNAGLEVFLLLLQAPGAALMIGGFASPRKRFVRNDLASIEVVPIAVRGGGGMGLVGRF
jgi:hypothetical protein